LEATVTNKLTDGELGGFLWNARDVSDRKALEDQLLRQALQDPLTGLANRVVLRDRLSNALARAARHHRLVGLLLFDLDGFKEINDDAGHAAGDAVLVEVATRLARHLRSVDTVARLGGDEFAMVWTTWPTRRTWTALPPASWRFWRNRSRSAAGSSASPPA